jgi:hypothetical protein
MLDIFIVLREKREIFSDERVPIENIELRDIIQRISALRNRMETQVKFSSKPVKTSHEVKEILEDKKKRTRLRGPTNSKRSIKNSSVDESLS